MRRAIESSAAPMTWACTPHSTPATSAGASPAAGSVRKWLAIRRAVTPLQVSWGMSTDPGLTDAILARCPTHRDVAPTDEPDQPRGAVAPPRRARPADL